MKFSFVKACAASLLSAHINLKIISNCFEAVCQANISVYCQGYSVKPVIMIFFPTLHSAILGTAAFICDKITFYLFHLICNVIVIYYAL